VRHPYLAYGFDRSFRSNDVVRGVPEVIGPEHVSRRLLIDNVTDHDAAEDVQNSLACGHDPHVITACNSAELLTRRVVERSPTF
jgi:hypothetical protein